MKILISFVNQLFSPDMTLGILESENKNFTWINSVKELPGQGVTGIATDKKSRIYCCIQLQGLAVCDFNLNVIQFYNFKYVKDPHSIIYKEEKLYVVSSGTNEVYELHLDSNGLIADEVKFWQVSSLPSYNIDHVHLNSITEFQNKFYVTMFGQRKNGEGWGEIDHGSLIELPEKVCLSAIDQPHTAYSIGDKKLIVCESRSGKLLDSNGEELIKLEGYIRGIAYHDKKLYVASSSRRKISKSQKKMIKGRVGEFDDKTIVSHISIIDTLSFTLESEIDLSPYGNEVYELFVLPNNVEVQSDLIDSDAKTQRIESLENTCIKMIAAFEKQVNHSKNHKKISIDDLLQTNSHTKPKNNGKAISIKGASTLDVQKIMPVIVYQMGKVASSTIISTLKDAGYRNLFQPHRILPENILAYQQKANKSNSYSAYADEEGILINKYGILKNAKIITLVREPIERNFSAFFQNYKMMTGKDFEIDKDQVANMIDKFMKNYPHDIPLKWFDDEFNKVIDIDIYDYPFDKQKGYSVITLEESSILIMRSELEDSQKESALQSFLNDESIQIVYANQSSKKSYNKAYKAFKNEILLPENYIDKMYQSNYSKHFYTDEEIEIFKQKWNRSL